MAVEDGVENEIPAAAAAAPEVPCPDCGQLFESLSSLNVLLFGCEVLIFFSVIEGRILLLQPQKAQPHDVGGHASQPKSSLMIVDDIFSCRQMKRMRKWLSKAMLKYQHQPQIMRPTFQVFRNSCRECCYCEFLNFDFFFSVIEGRILLLQPQKAQPTTFTGTSRGRFGAGCCCETRECAATMSNLRSGLRQQQQSFSECLLFHQILICCSGIDFAVEKS